MKKFLFAFIFSSLFLSCSEKILELHDMDYMHSDVIPIEEALSTLNAQIEQIYGLPTKSLASDYDVSVFGENNLPATKSEGLDIPDTLAYIVNFSENQGFAVLSANRKLSESVYCIVENGELSNDDMIEGFNLLSDPQIKSNADDVDLGEKTVPAFIISAMIMDLHTDGGNEPETKAVTVQYGPFLTTKWHQHSPFNDQVKPGCPAGCVAVAVAQIMAYNEKSSNMTYNGHKCDWTTMKTVCPYTQPEYAGSGEAKIQVAAFLCELGKRHNCYIRYDTDGSGGYADGAKRTLKNYGYSNAKKHLGFGSSNQKKAIDKLKSGRPVYLEGKSKGGGHAWVIDGYRKISVATINHGTRQASYFHINWGWNGDRDGYYSCGNFDTTNGQSKDSTIDSETSLDSGGVVANYTWNFRLVTY